ncbi:MAG: acetylornithine/succinylornithine family transaminase [Clostridia bacterium]|nr:acetylornithine/succinylornithine family transaminase [Clostridia bacterium]
MSINSKYPALNSTKELLNEAKKSILFVAERPEIVMERGQGMYLWDTDGKCYLDFIGGWGVTCLGHCPEAVKAALISQADELINASPSYYNKPMIQLAKLLTDYSCFDRVFFASSGAEANEGAIKLARKYGAKFLKGAYEIITTRNGFHGRTLATMSATGKEQWESLFAPKVPGFKHVEFNNIDSILDAVNANTCAVMLEPIQGEGGVYALDGEYITKLRKICDNLGILLIFDEVQTGMGRTGKLFAYQHYGIEPDIMTLGKGIGGGYPLSAMLAKEKLNIFEAGDQGGTYSGQPLGMAVGLAVVSEIINRNLAMNAEVQGDYIKRKLQEVSTIYNLKNIRGKGLLIGFDLPEDKGKEVVKECLEEGLLINSPRPATIRLFPALIVNREEIDKMFEILYRVLSKVL